MSNVPVPISLIAHKGTGQPVLLRLSVRPSQSRRRGVKVQFMGLPLKTDGDTAAKPLPLSICPEFRLEMN